MLCYSPYGQMVGMFGALTEIDCPYIVGHLITSEDALVVAMVSVYCIITLH